jgi:hypothetical protein
VSDVRDMRRLGDLRLGESASLLGLRRRMIELEDPQFRGPLESIGESVETGAQHQDLPHAFLDRMGRRILGEAAAHGDEKAQTSPLRALPGERDGAVGLRPEDAKRKRIGEHEPPLEDLVRRPVSRRAKRGHTCLPVLHGRRVGAKRGRVERVVSQRETCPGSEWREQRPQLPVGKIVRFESFSLPSKAPFYFFYWRLQGQLFRHSAAAQLNSVSDV